MLGQEDPKEHEQPLAEYLVRRKRIKDWLCNGNRHTDTPAGAAAMAMLCAAEDAIDGDVPKRKDSDVPPICAFSGSRSKLRLWFLVAPQSPHSRTMGVVHPSDDGKQPYERPWSLVVQQRYTDLIMCLPIVVHPHKYVREASNRIANMRGTGHQEQDTLAKEGAFAKESAAILKAHNLALGIVATIINGPLVGVDKPQPKSAK